MSEAYSVYWPQKRWLAAAVVAGQRLPVLFGGPHASEPSFRRAAVKPGDLLYPVGVRDQVLYVFARMQVADIIAVNGAGQPRLEDYLAGYQGWRFLASMCTTEVVIGEEGTAVCLDRPVPGEILKRLIYRPRRGPRPVKHVSPDGMLMHSLGMQGIYRLAESSEADLRAILTGPAGTPITRPRPGKRQDAPANMDPIF